MIFFLQINQTPLDGKSTKQNEEYRTEWRVQNRFFGDVVAETGQTSVGMWERTKKKDAAEDQTERAAENKCFWISLFSHDRCLVNLLHLKAKYMSWRGKKKKKKPIEENQSLGCRLLNVDKW